MRRVCLLATPEQLFNEAEVAMEPDLLDGLPASTQLDLTPFCNLTPKDR